MEFKILLTYKYANDTELPTQTQQIIDNMTGNANFTDPRPTLAEMQAARDEYERSIGPAKNGGNKEVNDKKAKRARLETMLRELGAYVIVTAKNNPEIIASSGFDVAKPQSRRAVNSFLVTSGIQSGQAISSMWRVPKTRMYVHQFTQFPVTDDSVWQEVQTSSRKHVHVGLKAGAKYCFRAKAITLQDEVLVTGQVEWIVQ